MLNDFTNALHVSLLFITLFTCMLVYIRVAEHYGILDKSNDQGSHPGISVKGGGVIFLIALLCWVILHDLKYLWFVFAAVMLAVVSFVHDVRGVRLWILITVQILAFFMAWWQVHLFADVWWLMAAIFVVGFGGINAFNFMDSINGMTGLYSLVTLFSFFYANNHIKHFTHSSLIVFLILSTVVFLFFNFRTITRCLTGTIGSSTLAFVQIFLLLQLIMATRHFEWALFFLVYAIDTTITVLHRLIRRENIFASHKKHLYQLLSNELRIPHLFVAGAYGMAQLLINFVLIGFLIHAPTIYSVATVVIIVIAYILIRMEVLKRVDVIKG